MVLTPRFTSKVARDVSGRAILTAGLLITFAGDLLFWQMARTHQPYFAFALAMLVAGMGAGVLNGETVKVLGGAVPAERAGMASGISSTTRFIGILFGVAGLGAVLSDVTRADFMMSANSIGLDQVASAAAARRVISGDLIGLLRAVPESLQQQFREAGLSAFSKGFSEAALLAATLAVIMSFLTFKFVRFEDTAPPIEMSPARPKPCMIVDCRDPI
jgi:hypothetical protein